MPRAHSITERPRAVEDDNFDERNDFLYLLLGLIAVSERVMAALPMETPTANSTAETTDHPNPSADHASLLR